MKVMQINSLDGLRSTTTSLSRGERLNRAELKVHDAMNALAAEFDRGKVGQIEYGSYVSRFDELMDQFNLAFDSTGDISTLEATANKFARDIERLLSNWWLKVLVAGGLVAAATMGFYYWKNN